MSSSYLPNHLLSNRKPLALSQADIAFLLGLESGDEPCRHERFYRLPSLETALAYEAIYKRPIIELFPGLYRKIEQEVAARAEALAKRQDSRKSEGRASDRRRTLLGLARMRIKS